MKTVVAGALGECVHVAGVSNFLRLAESAGWRTVFLGPAVPVETFLEATRRENADLVGVSYRLTPETGERLLAEFAEAAADLHEQGVRFAFGGTPPVSQKAEALEGFFDQIFDGSQGSQEILAYLRGEDLSTSGESTYPQSTIERIRWKQPYPLLRHHFGLPTLSASIEGIQQIAEAKALDVISLGIDQDAQANFFHPERQNPRTTGAGGVPVRSAEDYRQLYQASRTGNYPLMRTYSGTDDFIRLAEMYVETINIAWCAIPLFWFNLMDGRGPLTLEESIREHQNVMTWYGQRGIPVELNEPHHWGMRDAPDVVFVTSAYLSAYNAKAFGVKDYIAQLMFNSPPNLSDAMDLAKMLAILEMIASLEDDSFHVWRQTRTGLLSYPLEDNAARPHLWTSIYLHMALRTHIIHIVGHTEADHAATAADIIEASLAARRSIENALAGQPEMTFDPKIQARKKYLIEQTQITLQAIKAISLNGTADPLTDAETFTKAVELGILDALQLKNNPFARGKIRTRVVDGGNEAVDELGNPITEQDRLKDYLN
jgi:methylmalonyl-CoA mutase cobalamin-binding subunit